MNLAIAGRSPRSRKRTSQFLLLTWMLVLLLFFGGAQPARAQGNVLVLYDSTGDYGWMGRLYVQHLTNLLSHFTLAVDSKPVENYAAGDLNRYQTTIYLGVVYNNPLPPAFQSDFLTSSNTICWLGYNLWQVAWGDSANRIPAKIRPRFPGARFFPVVGGPIPRQDIDPANGRTGDRDDSGP